MKKPEKKELKPIIAGDLPSCIEMWHNTGHNQACDEWEVYHTQEIVKHMEAIGNLTEQLVDLPSEEEIENIVDIWGTAKDIAKALSKRIGENDNF